MFWIAHATDARSISGSVRAAEDVTLAIFHQADDHDFAAVQDALDLEPHEFVATLVECNGSGAPLGFHDVMQRDAQVPVRHSHEAPGLHETDAWRMVRGVDQPRHLIGSNGGIGEMPHVAAFVDRAVDRGNLGFGKTLEGRISHTSMLKKVP